MVFIVRIMQKYVDVDVCVCMVSGDCSSDYPWGETTGIYMGPEKLAIGPKQVEPKLSRLYRYTWSRTARGPS